MFFRGKLRTRLRLPILAGLFVFGTLLYINYTSNTSYVTPRSFRFRQSNIPPPPVRLPPRLHHHPLSASHQVWSARAEEVKEAFVHAYAGYKRFASGHDELKPVSNGAVDNFNGWGLTLVDALDTMWIMGLREEFAEALPIVANMTFALDESSSAPFFETVIRYLGGLLSAYALSNQSILLTRADDLGHKLLPAFNTSSGLPTFGVNTVTGRLDMGWMPGTEMLAEAMSCQMEYKYLAHLTGKAEYFEKVEKVMDAIARAKVKGGMLPTKWSLSKAMPLNYQFSAGGSADSAYEYMLKQWLLSSRVETKAKNLYLRTINAIINNLLYLSPSRHLLYATDINFSSSPPVHSRRFEHLSCFLPGLLTLGVHTLPSSDLSEKEREIHIWAAEGLANTCWMLYNDQPTGLGPDEVEFHRSVFKYSVEDVQYVSKRKQKREGLRTGVWMEHVREWERAGRPLLGKGEGNSVPPGVNPGPVVMGLKDYASRRHAYYLRPEAIESFYLMYRTTGDPKWRERGWEVFQALQSETRTASGYSSLLTVEQTSSPRVDEMPSYFMAETLKYLYLLFHKDDLVPLDKWVFNTEAHPLPMFEWTSWEKQKYHIY